jgi:Kef-type K+ transport system membrane component KefB
MKNVLNKFKNNLDTVRNEESGDIVQTILIIAVFVVIVVVVGKLLFDAINKRASSTSDCINGIGVATGGTTSGC